MEEHGLGLNPSLANMNANILQQVLKSHSYLDLTRGVSKEEKVIKGGGGFSDVYCSHLYPGWELKPDGVVQQLLNESTAMGHPTNPWKVAVKQLRSFGPTDTMVEKACYIHISVSCSLLNKIRISQQNSKFGLDFHIITFCRCWGSFTTGGHILPLSPRGWKMVPSKII